MGESRATDGGALGFVGGKVRGWRTGSRESQVFVLGVLLTGISVSFAVSLAKPEWMPLAAYFVWLLVAMLLLRFVPLVIAVTWDTVAAVVSTAAQGPMTGARAVAMLLFLLAVALVLFQASRQRSGLPVPVSEALLSDLRDRLQRQGRIPELPAGLALAVAPWSPPHGVNYAGDFLVSDLGDDRPPARGDPRRRGRQGHRRWSRRPPVRRGPRRTARRAAPARAVPARPTTSCSGRTRTSSSPPRCT